jgi:hypothetical protein
MQEDELQLIYFEFDLNVLNYKFGLVSLYHFEWDIQDLRFVLNNRRFTSKAKWEGNRRLSAERNTLNRHFHLEDQSSISCILPQTSRVAL